MSEDFDPERDLCGIIWCEDPPDPPEMESSGTVEDFLLGLGVTEKSLPPLHCKEEREDAIFQVYPEANPEIVQEFTEASTDTLIRFITSTSRTPREVATFRVILSQGYITKEDCYRLGFDPVVTRDLTKHGVVFRSVHGRISIQIEESDAQLGGFKTLPSVVRDRLIEEAQRTCALCGCRFERKRLVADHKVPHRVAGNLLTNAEGLAAYQIVCDSCNNRKQQACRGCYNQQTSKRTATCLRCRWASPLEYDHIALTNERRLILVAQTAEELAALVEVEALARARGLLHTDPMAHPFSKLRDAMSSERQEANKSQAAELLARLGVTVEFRPRELVEIDATIEEKRALVRRAEAVHEPCEDDTFLGGMDD